MTKPQALRKVGSMVCLGSNGFTVLENNKYYLHNMVLCHKTGNKIRFGLWAEISKDDIELKSCTILKQKMKTVDFRVPVEFHPDFIAVGEGDSISARGVLEECIFRFFSMLIYERESLVEHLDYTCSKVKELVAVYHTAFVFLHGEIDAPYLHLKEANKIIENYCPTADKIIEDFKSLGVEFKD